MPERTNGKSDGARIPSAIQEALKVLDEAAASQGESLYKMIDGSYENLRQALSAMSPRLRETLSHAKGEAMERVKDYAAFEKTIDVVERVDQEVRSNPWRFIGGVAASFMALGYFLGNRKVQSTSTARRLT